MGVEVVRQLTVRQPVDDLAHGFQHIAVLHVYECFHIQDTSGGIQAFTIQAIVSFLGVIGKVRGDQDIVQAKIGMGQVQGF